jgi:hypothetical protein
MMMMMSRYALLALALGAATPAFANPVNAENPSWQVSRQLAAYCAPGLKFAAGACVRRCPNDSRNQAGVCVFENQANGG